MNRNFPLALLLPLACLSFLVSCNQTPDTKHQTPKNVVLMIGDGMGVPQVSCGWVKNKGHLNLDRFPYTGFSRTYCLDHLITDSGAGGTALACGQKIQYYHVAVDTAGNELPSLIDIAHAQGMRTGVSVVCGLDDATPASFLAHDTYRRNSEPIIADFLVSPVDLIVGGGWLYFEERQDGRSILSEMAQQGRDTATTEERFFAMQNLPLIGVLAYNDYPLPSVRGDLFTRQTMKAIDMLDNEQGFFLMVEGSLIDGYCHDMNIDGVMEEMLDFDATVGAVLDWAQKDGNTLVVVTADHESGALTLLGGDLEKGEIITNFAHEDHSNIQVPIYAFGPGAEHFHGTKENCEWSELIRSFIVP